MATEYNLDYFYGLESEQFSFLRIPKLLLRNENFNQISSDAKLIYGLLLERMGLSQRNGWFDAQNRVYIIYTNKELCEDMNRSDKTITKCLKELIEYKLIEFYRHGQGKPATIYVKNFITIQESEDLRFKNRKGYDSRVGDFTILESENLRCNNTDRNKTINNLNKSYSLEAQAQNTSSDDISPVQAVDPSKIDIVPIKHNMVLDPCGVPSVEDISTHVLQKGMSLDNHDICQFIDYYNKANWVTANGEPVNWMHKLTNWETRKLQREREREEQEWLMEERERQIAENARQVAETFEAERKEELSNTELRGDVPTNEKVQAFIDDEGIENVDAEQFLLFYDGRHWLDGNGKLIKDWRSKIREWSMNGIGKKQKGEASQEKREQQVQEVQPDVATLDEVRAYVAERGIEDFDCDKFFNFYENLNWHNVQGKPVRSWKNLIESWDARNKTQSKAIAKTAQVAGSWEERKAREDAMREIRLLEGNLEYFNEKDEQQRKEKEKCLASIAEIKEKWGIE